MWYYRHDNMQQEHGGKIQNGYFFFQQDSNTDCRVNSQQQTEPEIQAMATNEGMVGLTSYLCSLNL